MKRLLPRALIRLRRGGQATRDGPRPGGEADRRVATETGTVESCTEFCKKFFDRLRWLMDAVFTVGQYNLVSWALNSFGVPLDDFLPGAGP